MKTENEITTREFSKKVLAIQDMAKIRAYELHLAKGGDECYGGYNPKWDNFGIKVLLNEVTQNPYPMTYEQDICYEHLDKSEKQWQEFLDNIKKEYVKSLDENNPILKRKKELREEITQCQEELLELELKTL